MECREFKDAQGAFVGFVCGPRTRAPKCVGCGNPATLECDGKSKSNARKTCDAPICGTCAVKEGKKDFCPGCAAAGEQTSAGASAQPTVEAPAAAAVPKAEQLVMCALCSTPTRKMYYWGDTTLCESCGAAWSKSQECQQANPAAPIAQWHERFFKWLDLARGRLQVKKPPVEVCKSCRAPILFGKYPVTGNLIPIDAEPVDNGNMVLKWRPVAGELLITFVSSLPAEQLVGRRRFQTHFASCPQAQLHRKKPAAEVAQP